MRTQVSIHLRFNFFVEFFGFFTVMNFLSSSNSSVKWSKHNVPFFKSSIVQKGMYIVKGGNVLEYRTKANAFSKPKSNHPLCRNPNLAKCGGEAQHLEKLGIWSPPGLPKV